MKGEVAMFIRAICRRFARLVTVSELAPVVNAAEILSGKHFSLVVVYDLEGLMNGRGGVESHDVFGQALCGRIHPTCRIDRIATPSH